MKSASKGERERTHGISEQLSDRGNKDGIRHEITLPAGTRDRALLGVLAFTGCRVGELVRLKVGSYKQSSVHRVLEIHGKGGKERLVPLNVEAAERLEEWLTVAGIRENLDGPLFRPTKAAWGRDREAFAAKPRRAVPCRNLSRAMCGAWG